MKSEVVAFVTESANPVDRPPPAVKRRRLLGLAAGGAAAVAGCSATALPGTGSPDDRSTADCPAPVDTPPSVCPDDDAGPLDIERTVGTVATDAETLRVTTTNLADEPYACNPLAWSVFRRAGADWVRVAPDAHAEPRVELATGEAFTWLLTVSVLDGDDVQTAQGDPTSRADPRVGAAAADHRIFLALPPGRHAFVMPFDGPERLAVVAPFVVGS